MSYHDFGPEEAFREGRCHIVAVGARQIGITRWRGRLYAINNVCAHQRGPLCRGTLVGSVSASVPGTMDLHEDAPVIACPWHGWEFDLRTGTAVSDERYQVRTFPVRVVDGRVLVKLGAGESRGPARPGAL